MAILNIYKPLGWTPLQCIERIRDVYPEYKNSLITYTGRLDPMAEGVIVFLTDEDRYQKPDFQKLQKTYEAKIIFGLKSDSYDGLGLVELGSPTQKDLVLEQLAQLKGIHHLPFPPFSSYKVQGKPLHWWTRENKLDEIKIPIKIMEVKQIDDVQLSEKSFSEIRSRTLMRVRRVSGDFRQKDVFDSWNALESIPSPLLQLSLTLEVTSGTYIRSLAHLMGQQLGCGAILFHLKRLKVGTYDFHDSFTFSL